MKRMWIGAALLAALLAAGMLVGEVMEKRTAPGAEKLRQAAAFARAEAWEQAIELTDSVREDWTRTRRLAEVLATHENLEQIEGYFQQLSACAGVDGVAFGTICTALAQQMEALGKIHGCSLENLF